MMAKEIKTGERLSTLGSISIGSATPLQSPRRPSIDNIEPSVEERKERYLDVANKRNSNQDLMDHFVENDEEYQSLQEIIENSKSNKNLNDSFNTKESFSQNTSHLDSSMFSLDMLPGEDDDQFLNRLQQQKELIKATKSVRSRSKSKRRRETNKHLDILSQSQQENKNILAFLESYEKEIEALKKLLSKSEQNSTENKKQLDHYKNLAVNLSVENKKMQVEKDQLQELAAEVMSERDIIQKKYDVFEKEKLNFSAIAEKKESELRSLEENRNELLKEVEKLKDSKLVVEKENINIQNQYNNAQKEINELLDGKKKSLEKAEIALDIKEDLKVKEKTIETMKTDLQAEILHSQTVEKERKRLQLLLETEKKASEIEVASAKTKLDLFAKDLELKTIEITNLQENLASKRQKESETATKFEKLENDFKEAETKNIQIQNKLELYEELNKSHREKIKQLSTKSLEPLSSPSTRAVSFDAKAIAQDKSDIFKDLTQTEELEKKISLLEQNNVTLIKQLKSSRSSQLNLERSIGKASRQTKSRITTAPASNSTISPLCTTVLLGTMVFIYYVMKLLVVVPSVADGDKDFL